MPCGNYHDKCDRCPKEQGCKHKEAFGTIKLVFSDPNLPPPPTSSGNPFAEISDCAPECGIKSVELVKVWTDPQHLLPNECIAFKIKILWDDCYFACGFVPSLLITPCAPDEHTYNADVRPLCSLNNNQCAFVRVDIFQNAPCYPQCPGGTAGILPTDQGVVAFNILATQGNECVCPKFFKKGHGHKDKFDGYGHH